MATDTLQPVGVPLRRRILRNGVKLLANEAMDAMNVPLVTDLNHILGNWVRTLRPLVLQVPSTNEESASEQAGRIKEFIEFAERFINETNNLNQEGNHSVDEISLLVAKLVEYLSHLEHEVDALRKHTRLMKFASQSDIYHLLEAKKEEMMNHIVLFCFKNNLLANSVIARSYNDMQEFMQLVTHKLESYQFVELANQHLQQDLEQTHRHITLIEARLDAQTRVIFVLSSAMVREKKARRDLPFCHGRDLDQTQLTVEAN
ncbi:hypothetical protein RhiJN_19264 [Ceratobasidium sp. AG-Ba]|nr:hypothetical protein RhiJN_19264 [Ceratobasidium sp. AG-Ba]